MLIALLSIAIYMIIMWYVYFYRGFLPRPKKTQQRERYDFDQEGYHHHRQQEQPPPRQYDIDPPRRHQQQQRPGATMTRSMTQQTMLPIRQKGTAPHNNSLLNTKFI